MQPNEIQNALITNTMNIFNSLSFYSPIIICVSIVAFSMFTATMEKAFVFFTWIFIITFIRIIVFKGLKSQEDTSIPTICLTGLTEMFIPRDVTYSTYILTFTMMYFITPMIMISTQHNVNAINYGLLSFFVSYIALDLFIKTNLSCIPKLFSKSVMGNILSGVFLGSTISGLLMYGTTLKKYLYMNEMNNNKEVCSMPSKQQFKCRLFKNGELVGDI
jgi:hypothetical protein